VTRARSSSTKSRSGNRRRYVPRPKTCAFCADKIKVIDYKDPVKLRGYMADTGKIEPRRKSGNCPKHQRALTVAIKRARHLALLPYVSTHIHNTASVSPVSTSDTSD